MRATWKGAPQCTPSSVSVWRLSPSPPSLLPHRLLKLPLVLALEFPAWPKPWFCFLSCSSGKWALDLHGLGLCQVLFSFTLTVTSQAFDPLVPSLPPTLLTLRFPFTTYAWSQASKDILLSLK